LRDFTDADNYLEEIYNQIRGVGGKNRKALQLIQRLNS